MLDVAEGKDPVAERKAERSSGSFADLAGQYVELYAKRHNKSWKQAEPGGAHLLPRWGGMKASAIARADVRAMMIRIDAPIVANQTLAAASAIFTWAVRQEIVAVNPCHGVDRNPTSDRERVLSDAETALLWPKLDPGSEIDPADRPAARRGRSHATRPYRRRLLADAGQAARRLAGYQERARSPGCTVGSRAGADRGSPCDAQQRPDVQPAAEEAGHRISDSSTSRRTICAAVV